LISPELQAERLKWDRFGGNDDNWQYAFGLEENSGWIGHNGQIPGYFTFEVYNPELDATIVIAMNSDKKSTANRESTSCSATSAKSCSLTTPSTCPSSNRRTAARCSGWVLCAVA